MKKSILLGVCAWLLGIGFWGNPIEAKAENYYYIDTQSVSGGDMVTVGKWYKGGIGEEFLMEGMPGEVSYEDMVSIESAPDEECLEWLKGLSGDLGDFTVNVGENVNIQIGSPENDLNLYALTNNNGNVVAYADVQMLSVGSSVPRDMQTVAGNTVLNGNTDYLFLGVRDAVDSPMQIAWDVTVNGNVREFSWVKSLASEETHYLGFFGNVVVTGTIDSGKIHEVTYEDSLSRDTWYLSGEFGSCATNTFRMTEGVLAEEIEVTEYQYQPATYYYGYQCYPGDETANHWERYAYNSENNEFAFSEDCSKNDIPDGAEVSIFGTTFPETLDRDVSRLSIVNNQQGRPVEFTLEGNVDELYIDIYNTGIGDIEIQGDVKSMYTSYRYNSEYNFSIDGKIEDGEYAVRRDGNHVTVGYFTAEDMWIIIDGEWNPKLFMYTSKDESAVGYVPIDNDTITDVLEGNDIGKEITVSTDDGEKTLIKAAEVLVEKTTEAVFEQLMQKEELEASLGNLKEMLKTELEKVKEAVPVCAIDISINTYFADKENGQKYEGFSGYGSEAVTQLEQGKNLEFTIKIPEDYFDANAKYSIIREHKNSDGTTVMDVLETEQSGDKLTFKSNKFSTFVIIKANMEEFVATPTEKPTSAPTEKPTSAPTEKPTPVPTEEPTEAPTAAPTVTPAPTSAPTQKKHHKVEPTPAPTLVPVTYTVQRGDTLSLIAYKYGMTLKELLALNPQIANPNLIYCNQLIIVGTKQGTGEEPAILAAEQYYTVEKGDSLYKIARKHKMTLRELTALNRALARQRYIYAGQRVKIK